MSAIQQLLISLNTGTDAIKFLDGLTAKLALDLNKRLTTYNGPAVRAALAADSGATTLDIGFDANGFFDIVAYQAFGNGDERIVTWYDQSGSGFDFSRAWSATLCPFIRISAYNGKPCIAFTGGSGSLGNAGFTDWNGKSDLNFIIADNNLATVSGAIFVDGGISSGMSGGQTTYTLLQNGAAANQYNSVWERNNGMLYRVRFNGAAVTDSDKLKLYFNRSITGVAAVPGTIAATWPNKTGLYLNGLSDGSAAKQAEYFGFYYFDHNIDANWSALQGHIVNAYYSKTTSQGIPSGDSLTVSYNLNVGDPTNTYPQQTRRLLETFTGTTWNVPNPEASPITAEIGAVLSRIAQLARLSGIFEIDDWQVNRTSLFWGGTNDLAAEAATAAKTFTADATTNILTAAGHGLSTGFVVRVSNSGGVLPAPLVAATDYFVEVIDVNTFYLCTTYANALNSVRIDLTTNGTGTNTETPTASATGTLQGVTYLSQQWKDYGTTTFALDMLPRTDLGAGNAAFEAARLTFNAGFLAALPAGVTGVQVSQIPQLATVTPTYFFDNVHLTLAGYTLIAQTVATAVEGVV